jgi:mono/diheme cytochrome c family protein
MSEPSKPEAPQKPGKVNDGVFWLIVFVIVLIAAGNLIYWQSRTPREIVVPAFNALEQQGAGLFAAHCASCHGEHARGSDSGPTLIHHFYEPNLHGDSTFYDAIRHGAYSHHWNFGDMPAVDGIKDAETAAIVAYVRKLQFANGLRWE